MKLSVKIVIYIAVAILIAGLGVGSYFATVAIMKSSLVGKYDVATISESNETNKIYFLNTGGSDAIIIESNGRFGMIDCAEDSQNPRNFPGLELQGYEEEVLRLVKAICGDENGNVKLDFVLGTHSHSDHIGGFDTLTADEKIFIDKAYLKKYNPNNITDNEVNEWDNTEVYNEMVNALAARNIPLVQDLKDITFELGNLSLTVYNGENSKDGEKVGENENSVGVLVSDGTHKIFLAGDINDLDGDETRIAPLIGEVDVLKLGHHGYDGSTTTNWVKALNPKIAIQTNVNRRSVSMDHRLAFVSGSAIFSTVKNNGIAIGLGESLKIYKDVNAIK